jgi:hypothetical protein
MRYLLLTAAIIFNSMYSYSQNSYDIDQRRGKLFFNIGTEYRITPFYKGSRRSQLGISTNVDGQNSGIALSGSLDYFITRDLSLGIGNGIRYDVLSLNNESIDAPFGVQPTNDDLLFSFHFYLDYHFKIFRNSEMFLRVGRSNLNGGSTFTEKETFFDQDGNVLGSVRIVGDYSFGAGHYAIGWKKNRISIIAGIFTSTTTEYFINTTRFNIPYLSFKYNLGKL